METASIIIRTYNEQRYLDELLQKIHQQKRDQLEVEVVIVDSGSTDETLEIARRNKTQIYTISKSDFSFGRSLNVGCEKARGDYLIFISGHCVPMGQDWLMNLVEPIRKNDAHYVYGLQKGGSSTRFSEQQLLQKYFPEEGGKPLYDFFINNANSCVKRSLWEKYRFNEDLTGLEDMEFAKRILKDGYRIKYVPGAGIHHYHHESWAKIKRRYEREAIALQQILPEIHLSFSDFMRYWISAVLLDASKAIQQKLFWKKIGEIVLFRFMQFWGSYRGNHEHRRLSKRRKEKYFFPR